jgi:hypothetical protein
MQKNGFSRPYTCRECPGFIEMDEKASYWKHLAMRALHKSQNPNSEDSDIWQEIEESAKDDVEY